MARKVKLIKDYPRKTQEFILFAQGVVAGFTATSSLANPPITLASVTALIDLLVTAETPTPNKVPTTVEDRASMRAKIETALGLLLAFAQSVIDTLPYEQGAALAVASGFKPKKAGSHTKEAYKITRGANAGTATIDLKSLGRHGTVIYCHQYSITNATSWVDAPPTPDTKALVAGLPVGTTVYFRFRTLIKGVYSDWSEPLSFAVH